jgi:membrane protease YdiL (CAAX protease family)
MDLQESSYTATEPQVASDQESPAVWGAITTLLWTGLIAIVFVIAQILTGFIYAAATMRHMSRVEVGAALQGLQFDPAFLFFCTFATLLVGVPLIIGIVTLKRGSNLTDYLGLKVPRLRQVLQWSLITFVFCGLVGVISSLLRQPTPEFMVKVYGAADPPWLLWLAVAVDAPVFEEICFRGFIFKGLAASRLRWSGAAIITSLLWAAIHLQYGRYDMSIIFALGLLLGTARAMTNSTLLVMWLHCLVNVIATVEIAIALRQMPGNN